MPSPGSRMTLKSLPCGGRLVFSIHPMQRITSSAAEDILMHVPFGWVALLAGVVGAVIYIVSKFRGTDTDFTLLAASLAAFVAG